MAADKNLIEAVSTNLREAWEAFHQQHPDEIPYAAGVYTTDTGSYFIPFVLGEQGYSRVADDEDNFFLRWNVADSPYHEQFDYQRTEDALAGLPDPFSFEDENQADAATQDRFEAASEATQALDKDGLFGEGAERAGITLLITAGDIDESVVLGYAKTLNPEAVYKAFQKTYEG